MTTAALPLKDNDREIIAVIGYIAQPDIDLNEYYDWTGKTLRILDLRLGLERDNFPPGLALRDQYGTIAVVRKDRRTLAKIQGIL